MKHLKTLLITLAITFSSCSELYTLTYITKCSRSNMAYYFSNRDGIELTIVDSCGVYHYGKKVSRDWIIKQSNK